MCSASTAPVSLQRKSDPDEFHTYLNYTRCMRFEDRPDYVYVRRLFRDLFYREGLTYDFNFDWTAKIQAAATKMKPDDAEDVNEPPFGETDFPKKKQKSDEDNTREAGVVVRGTDEREAD